MISFSDLFTITMNPVQVILTLIVGLLMGLYVWFIYKKTFSGVMYSRTYGMTLVMMTVVTALMLMLINNSLTLSLGMVGALSIVRYRTAIKDPLDTAFIFWAVGEGIAVGTKFYDVAVIAGIMIGIFVLLISGSRGKGGAQSYLLIIHYSEAAADAIRKMTKQLPGPRQHRAYHGAAPQGERDGLRREVHQGGGRVRCKPYHSSGRHSGVIPFFEIERERSCSSGLRPTTSPIEGFSI